MLGRFNFNYSQKTKPFPHQIEATEYVASNKNSALFDEQGLGKTKIVIDALIRNIKDNELNRINSFLLIRKFAIVLDESHTIKNPKAKSTQAIWTLSKRAQKRIII